MEADDFYLPLQDQRVFGAGIKRKRINFIRASTSEPSQSANPFTAGSTIASRYLSIVLQEPRPGDQVLDHKVPSTPATNNQIPTDTSPVLCPVCAHPMSPTANWSAHESSISHQLCLEHVQPPSHLPRAYIGVRYLTSHGWDPDARRGLGARQEGITVPIKAKEKNDTAGLRETEDEDEKRVRKTMEAKQEQKLVKLNAKELRIRDLAVKRRAERLKQNFYGPDLEKYLGPEPP